MATFYHNNDVSIATERANSEETKVNVNGQNLIWISSSEREDFENELASLLDRYRI